MATLPDVRRQPPCARPAASACSRAAPHRLRPGRRRCALPPQALPQWDGERAERELVGGEPALLSVGTRWCGPCAALAPALLEAAGALEDTRVKVGKLDADDFPELATQLGVQAYPTTLVFRDGAELWRCEGLTDARELVRRACAALTGEEAEVFLMENEQWR